jgi:pimeloyl-ACP methyl ester carboxylesterase
MPSNNPLTFLPFTPQPTKPLIILLAGMDGTGQLMYRQVVALEAVFEVRCLAIPLTDCSPWDTLTTWAVERVKDAQTGSRPVVVCGESFGACLALKMAAAAPDLVQHLILVNSASAFGQRGWLVWGTQVNPLLPLPLQQLAAVGVVGVLTRLERLAKGDRRLFLQILRTIPPATSQWRFSLLREFFLTEADTRRIRATTLCIASARDLILPSVGEARRLAQCLPKASVVVLPNSGHCCLIEESMNLLTVLQTQGFLTALGVGV